MENGKNELFYKGLQKFYFVNSNGMKPRAWKKFKRATFFTLNTHKWKLVYPWFSLQVKQKQT